MDPNANTSPVNPDSIPPSKPHDIAEPGPIDPATGQPDHGAEVTELKSWFRENAVSLVLTVAGLAAVCLWLDPIDTLKVVLGLGFIIFIHELGHFVAAKWCDVHVRTFSIGFGPAVPFCSYKWGETTYMVGIVPLGGYVAMVGEGEEDDAEEDPRSFRKKTVGQRMFIISMGVIMNVILGTACFVAAYLHGVRANPASVGTIQSGGAAWRSGLRSSDHITKIGSRENPTFDDISPRVMSSDRGELIPIEWERADGKGGVQHFSGEVAPFRDEGQRFPQIGVSAPAQLTLVSGAKRKMKPVVAGTPAAEAVGTNGARFEPGDRILKMSNPDDPKRTPTTVENYDDYYRRAVRLAAEPITFEVQRKDSAEVASITVKPAYRHDLGIRMRMGEVAALRKDGGAEKAGIVPHSDGQQPIRGDRIKAVMLPPNPSTGERIWYVAGLDFDKFPGKGLDFSRPEFATDSPEKVTARHLDPLLLPAELNRWADGANGPLPVELVVLRADHPTDRAVRVWVPFDPAFRYDRETAYQPNSPLPLSGLGLAYWVEAVVDEVAPGGPGAEARTTPGELSSGWRHRLARSVGIEDRVIAPGGELSPLKPNDVITAVRIKTIDDDGNIQAGEWKDDLKPHQWASVDAVYQQSNALEIDIRVKRGDETIGVTLKGRPATDWPQEDRGLIFQSAVLIQQAADVGDAVRLGGLRTVRFIKTVYMNLYGYLNNRISVKTLSGPLTIANVAYKLAGEDFWQFLLFLGMISVNLAVVNFLPIPVLDGGHMVFLILEKILGRPVPERVFAVAMYTGLFLIVSLMLFVLFLDAGRLF